MKKGFDVILKIATLILLVFMILVFIGVFVDCAFEPEDNFECNVLIWITLIFAVVGSLLSISILIKFIISVIRKIKGKVIEQESWFDWVLLVYLITSIILIYLVSLF